MTAAPPGLPTVTPDALIASGTVLVKTTGERCSVQPRPKITYVSPNPRCWPAPITRPASFTSVANVTEGMQPGGRTSACGSASLADQMAACSPFPHAVVPTTTPRFLMPNAVPRQSGGSGRRMAEAIPERAISLETLRACRWKELGGRETYSDLYSQLRALATRAKEDGTAAEVEAVDFLADLCGMQLDADGGEAPFLPLASMHGSRTILPERFEPRRSTCGRGVHGGARSLRPTKSETCRRCMA